MHFSRGFLISLLVISASIARAEAPASEEQFQQALKQLEDRNFPEAVRLLEEVLVSYPDDPGALWNYGIAAAAASQHRKAATAWTRYRTADPENWQARTKLIQAYQALGETAERDAERAALIALRESGSDASLSEAKKYCREQFQHGGTNFFVFEYFNPSGERRVFYEFTAVTDAGYEAYRISLGSYDSTNQISWELGDLHRSERLYHLDRYEEGGHQLVRFYESMPEYARIREDVVAHLVKRAETEALATDVE